MNKDHITHIVQSNRNVLEELRYKVSPSGKSINYDGYSIAIVMSKYGYDSYFGLNFFLRATLKNTPRVNWPDVNPFKEGLIYDWNPALLKDYSKDFNSQLNKIYDKRVPGKHPSYFSALDERMLEDVTMFMFTTFACRLENVNKNDDAEISK